MDKDKYKKWKKEHKTEALTCDSREPLPASKYNYLEIEIKNLSDRLLFKNLSIAFGIPPDSPTKIKASQLLSKAPALKGDNVEKCNDTFVQIEKINFHPLWEYTLILAIEGKSEPYAVLLKSDKATIFEKGSFKTWIVRNEVTILLASLLMGLVIAILYLIEIGRTTIQRVDVENKND
jgi:hypothetical protein